MQHSMKEFTIIPDKTFPINIFFVENDNSPLIHLHWHEHLEWIYVLKGQAKIQIDANFIDIKQGDLVFVNSKQIHGATTQDSSTELVAIVLNDSLIRNNGLDSTETRYILPILDRKIVLPNLLNFSDPAAAAQMRKAIETIIVEFKSKQTSYELIIKSELYRIFGLMIRYYHQIQKNAMTVEQKVIDDEFRYFFEFLQQNFAAHITIDDASKMVYLSPSHFCRVFKKITGKTFIEYLHILRIHKAESLLRNTNLPVTLISDEVGFGCFTYFSLIFRKHKSVSPSVFRKLEQNK